MITLPGPLQLKKRMPLGVMRGKRCPSEKGAARHSENSSGRSLQPVGTGILIHAACEDVAKADITRSTIRILAMRQAQGEDGTSASCK